MDQAQRIRRNTYGWAYPKAAKGFPKAHFFQKNTPYLRSLCGSLQYRGHILYRWVQTQDKCAECVQRGTRIGMF